MGMLLRTYSSACRVCSPLRALTAGTSTIASPATCADIGQCFPNGGQMQQTRSGGCASIANTSSHGEQETPVPGQIDPSQPYYTYREAAIRVGRSVRTIVKWKQEGMPSRLDAIGRVIIQKNDLLSAYRRRLEAIRKFGCSSRAARSSDGGETNSNQRSCTTLSNSPPARTNIVAAEEWHRLQLAIGEETPACAGDSYFVLDRPTAVQKNYMHTLCSQCPVRNPCREYAIAAKPSGGYWAGVAY